MATSLNPGAIPFVPGGGGRGRGRGRGGSSGGGAGGGEGGGGGGGGGGRRRRGGRRRSRGRGRGRGGASDKASSPSPQKQRQKKPSPTPTTGTGRGRPGGSSGRGRPSPATIAAASSGRGRPGRATSNKSAAAKANKRPQHRMSTEGHSDLASNLIAKLQSNTMECIICMAVLRRGKALWSCTHCHCLMHQHCIQQWARKSADDAGTWKCPHCQAANREAPAMRCYCGKVRDPPYDAYLVSNSCGETCGRSRGGSSLCPHTCRLPCHPGPCPPCVAKGTTVSCHCGRTSHVVRCGVAPEPRACEATCGRTLSCGRHTCELSCHPGPCTPCSVRESQACYCGQTTRDAVCGQGDAEGEEEQEQDGDDDDGDRLPRCFACDNACSALLACGEHLCERTCHRGPCGVCPRDPSRVTRCPCGRTTLDALLGPGRGRTLCTDAVPTCAATCDKVRPCGHRCDHVCHVGPCPPCTLPTKVRCRCGCRTDAVQCYEVNWPALWLDSAAPPRDPGRLCHQRCSQLKTCGKHRCSTTCCASFKDAEDAAGFHVCALQCKKPLKCGNHRCREVCHRGRCPPCLEATWTEVVCPCGRTTTYPPIRCGDEPTPCPHPCHRERSCGHPCAPHPCHSDDEACPPCATLVQVACMCGKQDACVVPCYQSANVSCGRVCGHTLRCGVHLCTQLCHVPPCQDGDDGHDGDGTASPSPASPVACHRLCGMQLPHCEHRCLQPCHPGQACPDVECEQETRIACPCKRRTAVVRCGRGGPNDDAARARYEPPANDVAGDHDGEAWLVCDEECTAQRRRRALAQAFGRAEPPPNYATMLIGLARVNPHFVDQVEKAFDLHLAANTPVNAANVHAHITFPHLHRIQRKIVHELARFYGFETLSIGTEPERHVVVKMTYKAVAPHIALSSLAADVPIKVCPPSGASSKPERASDADADIMQGATAGGADQQGGTKDAQVEVTRAQWAHCGVLLSNFPPDVNTLQLHRWLHHWTGTYTLDWIDDRHVLCVFSDPLTARAALTALQGDPFAAYRVRPYFEDDPELSHELKSQAAAEARAARSGRRRKTAKPGIVGASGEEVTPGQPRVRGDVNPFHVLDAEALGAEDDAVSSGATAPPPPPLTASGEDWEAACSDDDDAGETGAPTADMGCDTDREEDAD